MKKVIISLPLAITFILFIFLFIYTMKERDPAVPPSALINKHLPDFRTFDLLDDKLTISHETLDGNKSLINFFASWCVPCKTEHPILMQISKNHNNIIILGINYMDSNEDAIKFIDSLGNPFSSIGTDDTGKIAMDFGVYGLPETFIINEQGIIVFKHVGPITKKIYNEKIKELLSN